MTHVVVRMVGASMLKRILLSVRFTPYAILLVPSAARAAPSTFYELAHTIVEILDTATFTLIIFGIVVYFWGMASNIPHFGDEKGAEKRKSFFFWGLVVLFVMASIWGIIQVLQNTLFGSLPFSPNAGDPAVTLCDSFGDCSIGGLGL